MPTQVLLAIPGQITLGVFNVGLVPRSHAELEMDTLLLTGWYCPSLASAYEKLPHGTALAVPPDVCIVRRELGIGTLRPAIPRIFLTFGGI